MVVRRDADDLTEGDGRIVVFARVGEESPVAEVRVELDLMCPDGRAERRTRPLELVGLEVREADVLGKSGVADVLGRERVGSEFGRDDEFRAGTSTAATPSPTTRSLS